MVSKRPLLKSALLICGRLLFGAALGVAFVKGQAAYAVPHPAWYSDALHRFVLGIMIWTLAVQENPRQMVFWGATDVLALCAPYIAGVLLAPEADFAGRIAFESRVGSASSAACFGVAMTQGAISLIDDFFPRKTADNPDKSQRSTLENIHGRMAP